METYNYEEFKEAGLDMVFVQDNQSSSTKGVLRGLHYQKNHTQGKLVRVLSGEVYDVAVDIRKGSKTYGKWFGVTLSAEKKNMFYIPEGFAHGFYVLSDSFRSHYQKHFELFSEGHFHSCRLASLSAVFSVSSGMIHFVQSTVVEILSIIPVIASYSFPYQKFISLNSLFL